MTKQLEKIFEKHPACAVFWLVLLVTGLATAFGEITRIDVRFGLMVQDMAKYGMGVFATINGYEYADYPSVFVACSYLTTLGGRFLNLWSLTLPTQICGALCCALIYRFGEKIRPYAGLTGVLLLLCSWTCVEQLTAFSIDLPVALGGLWLAWRLTFFKEKLRFNLLGFAGILLLCFLIRGPFGILMIGGSVGGLLLAERRWKEVLLFGITGVVMTAFNAALGWKLIDLQGGKELMQIFYDWQIGSRMAGGKYGFFYFFTNGIGSYAPVTVAGVLALLILKKESLRAPYAGLFGFILLPLIMLGIPNCKHLRYMAITIPAFAILGGIALTGIPEVWKTRLLGCMKCIGVFFHWLLIPAALILVILGTPGMTGRGCAWFQLALVCCFVLGAGFIPNRAIRLCCTVVVLLFWMALPFQLLLEGARDFVRHTEMQRARTPGARVGLYGLGFDHEDLKYVFHTLPEKREEVLYFYKCNPETHLGKMYPGIAPEKIAQTLHDGDFAVCRDRDEAKLAELMKSGGFSLSRIAFDFMGHKVYGAFQIKKLQ